MDQPLYPRPYQLRNNRKINKARIKQLSRVQSIPVYEQLEHNGVKYDGKLLGYKYIVHA